jgi:carboxypeptidase Taq
MTSNDPAISRLYSLYGQIREIEAATAVLGWDQETMMPPKGQQGRGQVLATLAGLRHAKLTSSEFSDAIDGCADLIEPGSVLEAQVREAKRKFSQANRIPVDLAKALAKAESNGLLTWQRARKAADFSIFQPELEQLYQLVREKACALADGGQVYDALLDLFEPGSTEQSLQPLFDGLRQELAPLVQAVAESGVVIDESVAQGSFAEPQQLKFGKMVAERIGFDFDAGRLDLAAHPFCSGFGNRDVRLTWRFQVDDFRPALFGIMHEAGHGLYEQGLPADWQGTPIGDAVGLGVHESQSRLWENLVGRSVEFWHWAMPEFIKAFPQKQGLTPEQLFPALHTVKPSLIRVEADEATYNLHVAARFEIERKLFAGQVEVRHLPELWNQTYQELLGLTPANDAEGVLQDIHWAMGAFGYFPTYTLGNLINAQLFQQIEQQIPNLRNQFAEGEFSTLLEWLRDRIHRHGSRFSAAELVQRATGSELSPDAFLGYIRKLSAEVYGIGATTV